MPVNKKYLNIGVACLAVTALVIGLSVGLTQKNKNNNNAAASSNAAYDTYDIDSAAYEEVCYGKSGKSGGGSGKSGKSGGYSMSYEGKSGKSGNRALYVPGILEAYGDDTDASTGKRRKLRHQLLGKLLLSVVILLCMRCVVCLVMLVVRHLLLYTYLLASIINSLTHCDPSSPLCFNRFIQLYYVKTQAVS